MASCRIIMIGNRKGGVTKTTCVVNLSYELAKQGKKVLIVDLDSQADTTKFFTNTELEYFVGHVMLDKKFDVNNAIYPAIIKNSAVDNLFIMAGRSGDQMTKLDMDMISLTKRDERLLFQLDKIKHDFDFILIDTSPSSNVLMMNAVNAADEFIIPTEYKEHSMDGIQVLLDHIQDVKFIEEDEINFMIVPSRVDRTAKKSITNGTEYLSVRYPHNVSKSVIYQRSSFSEAEFHHLPVSYHQPSSEAAMYYKNLSIEVIENE